MATHFFSFFRHDGAGDVSEGPLNLFALFLHLLHGLVSSGRQPLHSLANVYDDEDGIRAVLAKE